MIEDFDDNDLPAEVGARVLDIHSLAPGLRPAVSYLRVSTKEQAAGGGRDEGFSIPAQRLANHRKAASIGAAVVAEFIDAGESARKADRPQLKAMLDFVQENQIEFCIVHKVDRLARNRVDDVEINVALQRAGVKLVSASENIDETPSGMLLHGIMSTIAEFYSRNLATEVSKGLTQKAVSGGTVSRAPIGYRNVRRFDALGREYRTIEVDDERAVHVKWAFETYATGEWSLAMLQEELKERGLMTRPTPKLTPKPLLISNLHRMLRNPYYVGEVIYRGASYEGSHEPIIDTETWHKVQDVLDAHNSAGDRQRVHEHYLKGSVSCGSCGSRLMINKATNNKGVPYDYFVCLGRHRKRTDCSRQAMAVTTIETAVENAWTRIRLTPFERKTAEERISTELKQQTRNQDSERNQYENQKAALLAERSKLLTAHYADAIPLDLLKVEQERISVSLTFIERELSTMMGDTTRITDNLEGILSLLQHCGEAYAEAKPQQRRMMNQAVANKIYIDEDGSAYFELDETVAVIRGAGIRTQAQLPRLTSCKTAAPDKTNAPPALWATQFPDDQTENPRGFTASGISISKLPEHFHEQSWNYVLWVVLRGALSNTAPLLAPAKFLDSKRLWLKLPVRENQPVLKQHQVRLDEAGEQKVIAAYKSGKTIYEVGIELGIHRTTVSAILKRNGVKMRRAPKRAYRHSAV